MNDAEKLFALLGSAEVLKGYLHDFCDEREVAPLLRELSALRERLMNGETRKILAVDNSLGAETARA